MSVDTPEQLDGLKRAGHVVASTLAALEEAVAPGVTTRELDRIAASCFAAQGARSGPVMTYRFPGSICISVEDEVVHGVPGDRELRAGQLVTLDVAAEVAGYHADAARTICVAGANRLGRRLISTARAALAAGMRAAQPGNTLRDVGAAVESLTEIRGFRVVRDLTGHGIGRKMHESPTVHNWPHPRASQRLKAGMTFTIEPMIVAGSPAVFVDHDGWTIRTVDGGLSAHEEHTIVVADDGPIVITTTV